MDVEIGGRAKALDQRDSTGAGTMLDFWQPEELEELEGIETTLPPENRSPGEIVPVKLRAIVTEAGTLRLEALPHGAGERWKVEFDVRGHTQI
jgi:hypothetical protein